MAERGQMTVAKAYALAFYEAAKRNAALQKRLAERGKSVYCTQEHHAVNCRHFGKYGNYLGSHDADCTGNTCICRGREERRVQAAVAKALADYIGHGMGEKCMEQARIAIETFKKEAPYHGAR